MNSIKCSNGGCSSVFETEEQLSPSATYTCRAHTKVGKSQHFQPNQFDKDLRRAAKPIGTNHILNQGSDVPVSNSGIYDESGVIVIWKDEENE